MSLALHCVLTCFGGSTDTFLSSFIWPTQNSRCDHQEQILYRHNFLLAGTPSLPKIPKAARPTLTLTNFIRQQLISVVLRKGMG